MTALLLTLVLCAADAPISDAPSPPTASPTLDPGDSPSAAQFPRPSLLRLLTNTAESMARPLRPQWGDAFIIIPAIVGTILALHYDPQIHAALQQLPDPIIGGQELSYWGSYLGEGWVDLGVFLALGLFGGRSGQRAAIAGIPALLAVGVVSRVGKLIFRLERPSYDPTAHHWFSRPNADAMPSGHTMAAFATAAVLASEWPRLAPLFYALATYVGIARVQNSTHWMSDVVVGAALGTLMGLEAWRVTREFELEVQPWLSGGGAGFSVSRQF